MNKIYIDCTHTYKSGHNTGIQRVVKNIVENRVEVSKNFDIEIVPVIFYKNRYRVFEKFPVITIDNLAKKHKIKSILKIIFNFIRRFNILKKIFYNPNLMLSLNSFYENLFVSYNFLEREIIFSKNDILINTTWLNNKYEFYENLKNKYNIKIIFIVYDLIPINQKEFFSIESSLAFTYWFNKSINIIDKYICISNFVQEECYLYIKQNLDSNISRGKFDYFYLGANIKGNDFNTDKIEDDYKKLFETNNVFVTVSTIEPRKNHKFILNAFEKLWEKDVDVKYIIIGRIGWMVEEFIQKVQNHNEFNKRLFMLNNIDDEHLLYAYKNSKASIFASFIEGFGLPIIESLHNNLQVLASNIEIHREIGKDYISYFDLDDIDSLVKLIEEDNFYKNIDSFKWISWEESTKQLVGKVLGII